MLPYGRDSWLPEENMMSQRSKRELLEEIRPRYLKAKRSEKKIMLNEFVAVQIIQNLKFLFLGISRIFPQERSGTVFLIKSDRSPQYGL
jgi:hypothetical protein